MPRIQPAGPGDVPAASADILAGTKEKFGKTLNVFATVARSPAALRAMVGMFDALGTGVLAGIPAEAICIRVAQLNRCDYCLAAHVAAAKAAGATDEQIRAFRMGRADDPKLAAMLELASAMVLTRCSDIEKELDAARDVGVTDEEILELIATVALTIFTNYTNITCDTQVDFPPVPPPEEE